MTTITVNLNVLNQELAALQRRLDFSDVAEKAEKMKEKFEALGTTTLGRVANEINAGFQAITEEVDEALDEVESVLNKGVCLLVEDPPGIEIRAKDSDVLEDVKAITGEIVEGGFLVVAVAAAIPEAIHDTLKEVADASLAQIQAAIAPIANAAKEVLNEALSLVNKGIAIYNDIVGSISRFVNGVATAISNGLNDILGNIIEGLVKPFSTVINGILDGVTELAKEVEEEVFGLIKLGFITDAAEILKKYTTKTIEDIENALIAIPKTITETIDAIADLELPEIIIKDIGEKNPRLPESVELEFRGKTTRVSRFGNEGVEVTVS